MSSLLPHLIIIPLSFLAFLNVRRLLLNKAPHIFFCSLSIHYIQSLSQIQRSEGAEVERHRNRCLTLSRRGSHVRIIAYARRTFSPVASFLVDSNRASLAEVRGRATPSFFPSAPAAFTLSIGGSHSIVNNTRILL